MYARTGPGVGGPLMVPFSDTHRPWPAPHTRWVGAQTWADLLFAHWPIRPNVLRPLVPPQLPIDTFDGYAWLSVVPFDLRVIRARGLPPIPALSRFLELNVRIYTTLEDKPGVFFFSLDAGNPAAVAAARLIHLPYYYAWLARERVGDEVRYRCRRLTPGAAAASFEALYGPIGPAAPPAPGTLEYFLTERYCLYTVDRRGSVARLEIHHSPWPLRPAEAAIERNTMTDQVGFRLPDTKPLLHFVDRLDIVNWLPTPVRGTSGRELRPG